VLPLRDNIPSRSFPIVTVGLILANTLAFLYELSLGPGLKQFILDYGFVPGRLTQQGMVALWPGALTSMFLHGGWMHLIGNMLYLWIFGNNIEDSLGHFRFLLFYLLGGLFAALTQIYAYPNSPVPMIGASGAIAGVLGGYLLLFPRARVLTLVFFVIIIRLIRIPALIVLGFWFLMQLLSLGGAAKGNIAFYAHIGGFISGLALVKIFQPRMIRRRRRST
jgi:membrane associated rhomboid family serine protease